MSLKRLKYVSRQTVPMRRDEIDEIVAAAATRNAQREVTGALMVSGQVFFQILEGPPSTLDALYARIRCDPRHTDVVCLGMQEDCATRLFPAWAMRRITLDDHPRAMEIELRLAALITRPSEEAAAVLSRLLWAELRAA